MQHTWAVSFLRAQEQPAGEQNRRTSQVSQPPVIRVGGHALRSTELGSLKLKGVKLLKQMSSINHDRKNDNHDSNNYKTISLSLYKPCKEIASKAQVF